MWSKFRKLYQDQTKFNLIGPMPLTNGQINPHLPSILIDGGLNHQLSFTNGPLWLGDHDSTQQQYQRPSLVQQLSTKKDQSDLSCALDCIKEIPKITELHLHGLLGGSLDHELSNLGELFQFTHQSDQQLSIYLYQAGADKAHMILPQGEHQLEHHGVFSILTLHRMDLMIDGSVEYPIQKSTLINPLSSQTISNRATGKFRIESSGPILVYFRE